MIKEDVQNKLHDAYTEWKKDLQTSIKEAEKFSPPLLLSVTGNYCQAEKRVIVFGQETYGWQWDNTLTKRYPRYPENWRFDEIQSLADFIRDPDGVKNLCWGYRAFEFAKYQPQSHRTLFWQALREVQAWPNTGLMWSNVSRCDYSARSILQAPEEVREELVISQKKHTAERVRDFETSRVCVF